jgi:methylglutaconyl-CoA hydratase
VTSHRFLNAERRGLVEYLTLNRPDVRNALNDDVIAELAAWASAIQTERSVRVAVIAGAGGVFSSGADVSWMAKAIDFTREENVQNARALSEMFASLDRLPIPLIGRVHGAALGGGVGLAAVCDVVVAEENAVFGFTEVKLGILPAVISPFAIAKIGRSAARELFLSGARFTAARAREIGLVHRVVPADGLDAAVDDCVREFLSAGPEAVAASKFLIAQVAGLSIDEARPLTARAIAERRVSPEGQEGLRAFLEKRAPKWSPAARVKKDATDGGTAKS